jgi:hypothetical protein
MKSLNEIVETMLVATRAGTSCELTAYEIRQVLRVVEAAREVANSDIGKFHPYVSEYVGLLRDAFLQIRGK